MKKNFCALFLLLFPLLCFSQNDFHFSLAPRLSFTYGELNEILYGYNGEIVSQLDWEQKPLFNLGFCASANYKNFIVSADFDYSLPLNGSYMYDSDFEDGERYSLTKHPIINSKNLYTSLTAAYQIDVNSKIAVIPELQFNYIYTAFRAGIGSGTRRGRDIRVYGIDYKRHSFFIFTGLSLKLQPATAIIITTDFLAAPWNYLESYDYHHGKNHPFSSTDIQYGFFSKYKTEIKADFTLDKTLSLQLFTALLFGFPDKGDFYSDYYGKMTKIEGQQSGADIYYVKAGLALNFSL